MQKVEFTLDPSKANTTENKHVLKPFTAYTETLQDNWIISYTLDNYVTVYGEINGEYSSKSGYLNLISNDSDEKNVISIPEGNFKHNYNFADGDGTGNLIADNNPLKDIKFSGQTMEPELLTETIAYKNGTDITTGKFNYVYEAEALMAKYKISGVPICDEDRKLVGIITNRDMRFLSSMDMKIKEVMTQGDLVTSKVGTTHAEARVLSILILQRMPTADFFAVRLSALPRMFLPVQKLCLRQELTSSFLTQLTVTP